MQQQNKSMATQIFTLTEGNEFITLDKLLKLLKIVGSGGEAHLVITEGMVTVNGEVETQKRKKLREGDVVEFNGEGIKIIS